LGFPAQDGVDPPPELVLDIDISSNSLDKFPLFAAIGVREVWRYSKQRVSMYRREDGKYRQIEDSVSLPPLTATLANQFLTESREMQFADWLNRVLQWARSAASRSC
jgi:Uma2 family endonuclease